MSPKVVYDYLAMLTTPQLHGPCQATRLTPAILHVIVLNRYNAYPCASLLFTIGTEQLQKCVVDQQFTADCLLGLTAMVKRREQELSGSFTQETA